MSVFHPANVTSDGWEAPQTPQSHSPAINSCATDLIPRPSVPKSQVEVGWGCILSCMRTCCIGCILYTYSRLSSSRLACHAIQRIQRIQPYSHTRHTSYSAIQPPSAVRVGVPLLHRRLVAGVLRLLLEVGGACIVAGRRPWQTCRGGEPNPACIHEYTVFSRVFSHGSNTRIIRVNTYSEYVFTT